MDIKIVFENGLAIRKKMRGFCRMFEYLCEVLKKLRADKILRTAHVG